MFNYKIITSPSFEIDENIIKQIFFEIWKNINISQNWYLNIVFVTPEEIQELNKNYREKDSVTDVLSSNDFEDFSTLKDDEIAWEMIFCEEKILSQALEYWLWNQKEFYKLLIHSILHIIWYDHEEDEEYKIMQETEDDIWHKIFEKN